MVVFTQPCLLLSPESPITTIWRVSLVLCSQTHTAHPSYFKKCVHMVFLHKGSGSMAWTLHVDIDVQLISHKTLDSLRFISLSVEWRRLHLSWSAEWRTIALFSILRIYQTLSARTGVSSIQPSAQSNELIIIPIFKTKKLRHRIVKQLVQSNISLSPNLPHGTHSLPWLLCLLSSPILDSDVHPCISNGIFDLSTWGVKQISQT